MMSSKILLLSLFTAAMLEESNNKKFLHKNHLFPKVKSFYCFALSIWPSWTYSIGWADSDLDRIIVYWYKLGAPRLIFLLLSLCLYRSQHNKARPCVRPECNVKQQNANIRSDEKHHQPIYRHIWCEQRTLRHYRLWETSLQSNQFQPHLPSQRKSSEGENW